MKTPIKELASSIILFFIFISCSDKKEQQPNAKGLRRDFIVAVSNREINDVKRLLSSGEIDEVTKSKALVLAVQKNVSEIVPLLIQSGADVNATPILLEPVRTNNIELVKILVNAGANLETENCSLLIVAMEKGHEEIFKILLEAKADVNAYDSLGYPIITHAVCKGDYSLAKELLERGADPNVEDKDGNQPIVYAVHSIPVLPYSLQLPDPRIVELLTEFGASPNQTDITGTPVLNMAIDDRNADVVEVLLNAGADITAQDENGRSAFVQVLVHKPEKITELVMNRLPSDSEPENHWSKTVQAKIAQLKVRVSFLEQLMTRLTSASIRLEFVSCKKELDESEKQYQRWLNYISGNSYLHDAAVEYDGDKESFEELEIKAKLHELKDTHLMDTTEKFKENQMLINELYNAKNKFKIQSEIYKAGKRIAYLQNALNRLKRFKQDTSKVEEELLSYQLTLSTKQMQLVSLSQKQVEGNQ